MGLNLGVLGQVASRGLAGYQHGLIAAESETYKRKREKEQQDRELAHQALMETLAQNADTRAGAAAGREGETYTYDLSQRPTKEAKAAADLTHTTAETTHLTAPEPDAGLKTQEIQARIDNLRSEIRNRGKEKVVDPAAERRKYISQHLPERTRDLIQRDPLSGDITTVKGKPLAQAYRELSDEWEQINSGKVPRPDVVMPSRNKWTPSSAPSSEKATGWSPTEVIPQTDSTPAPPQAPQAQPADTLHGQMPHESGNLPPLEQDDIARAHREPDFMTYLHGLGYTVP